MRNLALQTEHDQFWLARSEPDSRRIGKVGVLDIAGDARIEPPMRPHIGDEVAFVGVESIRRGVESSSHRLRLSLCDEAGNGSQGARSFGI
ncbi:hypothetical protein D3C86_1762900 [compost metagenome]